MQSQSPSLISPPLELEPFFMCPQCNAQLPLPERFIDLYFRNQTVACSSCKTNLTAWQIATSILNNPFAYNLFYPLGAKTYLFKTTLSLHEQSHFDLYANGLPKDAHILDINCSGLDLFCFEPNPSRHHRNRYGRLQLFGWQKSANDPKEGFVHISVTWVQSFSKDIAWKNLLLAFDVYFDGEYDIFDDRNFDALAIPANVAVEAKLYQYIERALSGVASSAKLKNFLESTPTYSHQLNILLPLLLKLSGLPPFDSKLKEFLNELRKVRNSIAHQGRCEPPLTKKRSANLLVAALFCFRYIDYLSALPKN